VDGQVGGENLTFALNEVFTLLIDEAAGLGGDVLKFGGDALLILFSGHEHEALAVEAAALMQQAIESATMCSAVSRTWRSSGAAAATPAHCGRT
jgi:class 3 adenylate cyclase